MDKKVQASPELVSPHKRKPIKLEIVSSPERTSSINDDLREVLLDSASACDFNSYVDSDGATFMKIECLVNQDEKMRAWDLLRFKYGKSCDLTTYPHELID
jgi:hypothetical protein